MQKNKRRTEPKIGGISLDTSRDKMFRARQVEEQQSKSKINDMLGKPPNTLAAEIREGWA